MSTGALVTMIIGMLLIWGGLAATLFWALRTETRWGDDDSG